MRCSILILEAIIHQSLCLLIQVKGNEIISFNVTIFPINYRMSALFMQLMVTLFISDDFSAFIYFSGVASFLLNFIRMLMFSMRQCIKLLIEMFLIFMY